MNTIIGGLLKWANTVSSIPNCPKFVEPYGALCHGQDRSLGMVFPTAGSSTALFFFSDSRGGTTATAGTGESLRTGSEVSATSEHLPLLVESPAAKTAGVCRVRRGVVGGLK